MSHTDLIKRAFSVTWRYRPLWLFGFLLALCGGGGGGGGGNFNFPSGGGDDFGDFGGTPNIPDIDPQLVLVIIAGLICLALLFAVLGVVVRAVSRTALIGMVRQIETSEAVTVAQGWRIGWSARAWRLFLVGLVIGIPVAIVSLFLIGLAFSPLLLLLISQETSVIVISVGLTVLAFLVVLLVLLALQAVVTPIQELSWRRTVLAEQGVLASLSDTFGLIKRRLKDVILVWLLLFGIGLGWVFVALLIILPVALVSAALVGGIPAVIVYLISESWIGAAVTGGPLALLMLILVSSAGTGFYLIFQSAVWTLAYLQFQAMELETPEPDPPTPDEPDAADLDLIPPDPQPA